MRAFIVLCLVAVACAQYNYQPGSGGGGNNYGSDGGFGGGSSGPGFGGSSGGGPSFGGSGASGPSFGGSGASGPSFGGSSGAGPSFGGSSSGPSFGGSSGAGPSFGGSSGAGPSFGGSGASGPSFGSSSQEAPVQAAPEKEFITYTANDEDFHDPAATQQFANSVKQGLRVVFIKGPESSGLEDAALALAKNAASQQTAIYVLNKQTDLAALANKLNAENSNSNNKPDVHFVKYRTPEDAINAQKAIQGQYDALGGQSQHIDGGVASSLNFASQPAFAPSGAPGGAATSNTYLPASVHRRRFRLK
ncbi:glycine, alanine and asparagine-rich protein-like [Stomoxys calcitrans]|uniref:glycine, alanine and asparagine-rich protein-like n=1 Tax=Stomoxys calcitrans TaxID=35570 RepID=UPI0027E273FA|nr:glycine, alanine and asparagine-rich protein-like [Stomoxys calcitrans]